jgi:hypothetical protein
MTPLLVAPPGEKSTSYAYAGALTESEVEVEKTHPNGESGKFSPLVHPPGNASIR